VFKKAPKQISIVQAAQLYAELELKNSRNIQTAIVFRLRIHKDDPYFNPNEDESVLIWANIIGAALFPLFNSEAIDEVCNQAIVLWVEMFTDEFDLPSTSLKKAFEKFMRDLVSLRTGNDLTLMLRHELLEAAEDLELAAKLNALVMGNPAFWPHIFRNYGVPLPR
jgi:hypothetical protein